MQQVAFSITSARAEESGKPALVEGVIVSSKNNQTEYFPSDYLVVKT